MSCAAVIVVGGVFVREAIRVAAAMRVLDST